MTTVAILPVPMEKGGIAYHGVAGDKTSQGSTIGEALDALRMQLPDPEEALVVLVQSLRPDRFFGTAQQRRLSELMTSRREAQERGTSLPAVEAEELDALIETELQASGRRAAAFADSSAG